MEIQFSADSGDIWHIAVNKLEGGNVKICVYNRSIQPNHPEDYPGGLEL